MPMTPAMRTTGTTGMSVRKRRGTARAKESMRRLLKLRWDGVEEPAISLR